MNKNTKRKRDELRQAHPEMFKHVKQESKKRGKVACLTYKKAFAVSA